MKKRWFGHILRGESLVNKVIEERIEGKRGRGKPPIKLLGDNETHEKIKRRALDSASLRNWMPRTFFKAEHHSRVSLHLVTLLVTINPYRYKFKKIISGEIIFLANQSIGIIKILKLNTDICV